MPGSPASYRRRTTVAERYYDSNDADAFYRHVWGGDDIHIGIYAEDNDDIGLASRRTIDAMVALVHRLDPATRVIDLGAGYGGAARHLAERFRCQVTALNLSEVQNRRNRELTRAAGLSDRITVVHGAFEEIPAPTDSFDVVWSQDAFLHSADRARVLREAHRVLVPGGTLVFTDPMQHPGASTAALAAVYDRLELESLGSFDGYRAAARAAGFEEVRCIDLTSHLIRHYLRVREELERRRAELAAEISSVYLERALSGLENWVQAGRAGHLAWGILCFSAN
jgi:cyclopropane fatty-acyl-phospholipid synthase-like methyltransferase